jgi:hypothetical protein
MIVNWCSLLLLVFANTLSPYPPISIQPAEWQSEMVDHRWHLRQGCRDMFNHAAQVSSYDTWSAQQFADYCRAQNMSESAILSHYTWYLSDGFVAFAKTLSAYEETVYGLAHQYERWSGFTKFCHGLAGQYTPGLTDRMVRLRDAIQKDKGECARQLQLAQEQLAQEQRQQIWQQQATRVIAHDLQDMAKMPLLASHED